MFKLGLDTHRVHLYARNEMENNNNNNPCAHGFSKNATLGVIDKNIISPAVAHYIHCV